MTLVQEREQQRATVVYVPVFVAGAERVGGAISLTFRAEELLSQVLPRAGEQAEVRWIDVASGEALVGDADAAPGDAVATIDTFGARWRFEVVAPSVPVAPAADLAPVGILLTGLLLAAGVLVLVANEARLTRRAEELAERRGAELEDRNADLRRANHRLRDLDEVKDRVLRSVTHDLRNPITVIGGLTEVLQNHDVPEAQRVDLLGRIAHQADRLTALTTELVTAARLQSGQLTAERRPVDVVAAVRRVVTDVGVGEVHVAGWVPPAEVDPHHLERVVANLLTNARRHGAPPVRVSVAAVDGHVEVAVRDHGPGVAEEDRGRLFAEFSRLRPDGEGLGLGLAICAGLADLNGGDVRYETPQDGPGARFVLRLEPSIGEGVDGAVRPEPARFAREPADG